MERLFVYETLTKKAVRIKALGHEVENKELASIPEVREVWVTYRGEKWPSLVPDRGSVVNGEILSLPSEDLIALDKWEDHYKRIELRSGKGPVWVYVLLLKDQENENND